MKQHNNFKPCRSGNIISGFPFEIHSLQWLENNKEMENIKQIGKNYFQIIWIMKGAGIHFIDLQKIQTENNQLFFIKPGQAQQLRSTTALEGYVISFTESFWGIEDNEFDTTYNTTLFNFFANTNGIVLNEKITDDLKDIAERMVKEFESRHLFSAEILKRYLKIFLLYITRQLESSIHSTPQTRNTEIVHKFMALLEKQFKYNKMVADYARQLFVTPNYLNGIIKKTTGNTAGYHIRQRVVLEAKRKVLYSDTCMKEIAYYLGFNDLAHFSKFFKSTTGVNFSDFKKEKLLISINSSLAV
jgi:AraC family transcriptional regulator, transcriptional activator of pobA